MNYKVFDVDISASPSRYADMIYESLLKDLVVVLKAQDVDPIHVSKLIHKMTHIGNWNQLFWDAEGNYLGVPTEYIDPYKVEGPMPVQRVTGQKINDYYTGLFPTGELKWHCNLNGPDRADGVALQCIKQEHQTRTSWLNTNTAYKELIKTEPDFAEELVDKWCDYEYEAAKNWAETPPAQYELMIKGANSYKMRILQENVGGTKGIYFYINNALKTDDKKLYDKLSEFLWQEKFIYHHDWEIGDVVLSDQLLTLHRRPPYSNEVLENRILHRWTFPISNAVDPLYITKRNEYVSI